MFQEHHHSPPVISLFPALCCSRCVSSGFYKRSEKHWRGQCGGGCNDGRVASEYEAGRTLGARLCYLYVADVKAARTIYRLLTSFTWGVGQLLCTASHVHTDVPAVVNKGVTEGRLQSGTGQKPQSFLSSCKCSCGLNAAFCFLKMA